jgi:sulfur carrier protein ThiS
LTGKRESDNLIRMEARISATQAARTFSNILNRIGYNGDVFVVERGGKPVCRMLPAQPTKLTLRELADLLQSLPAPDAGYAADVRRASRRQGRVPRLPWGR